MSLRRQPRLLWNHELQMVSVQNLQNQNPRRQNLLSWNLLNYWIKLLVQQIKWMIQKLKWFRLITSYYLIKTTISCYLFILKTLLLYSAWSIFSTPGVHKFSKNFRFSKEVSQKFMVLAFCKKFLRKFSLGFLFFWIQNFEIGKLGNWVSHEHFENYISK